MSVITISLRSSAYAPWGLLTDEEKPRQIVWLTDLEPSAEVDRIILTDYDIERIRQSERAGVVHTAGLDLVEEPNVSLPEEVPAAKPIQPSTAPKIADSNTIMDVTQLLRCENERAQEVKQRVMSRYPEIDTLLEMPAHKLKKRLKELAKGNSIVSFFQECRKKEAAGKDRKTVIAVLIEIIQAKINVVGLDSRQNGYTSQTSLSNAYYDMIEEFEDEDEGEESMTI